MKILLFGKNGQLGWELQRALASFDGLLCFDYPEVDLTKPDNLCQILAQVGKVDVIINAAAYTAVDQAENEPELARAINRDAPALMAEEAKRMGAAFIHYSTDYVYDGKKNEAYIESDEPSPLSMYGLSKLEGDEAVQQVGCHSLILRTSWVYSMRGETFVKKVLRWARSQTTLQIVDDQISNPTWARALAQATVELLLMVKGQGMSWLIERKGLYHLAGSGYVSRYEWAWEIIQNDPRKEEHLVQKILAANTADFPTPAVRPLFSALSCDAFYQAFGFCLPSWRESLEMALNNRVCGL